MHLKSHRKFPSTVAFLLTGFVFALMLVSASPAFALETVATFASNCTTPKTVFQLGDTVCAKVSSVPGGALGNIWLQWVAPDDTVAFGSTGTTLVTTDPQTFLQTLPTTGASAQLGTWQARTANVSDSSPRVAANFRVPRVAVVGVRRASNATFYSRNTNTTGFAEGSIVLGNTTEDIGFWGDWTGIGTFTPGFYRPSDGTFHLSTVPGSGVADLVFQFGPVGGGSPVVGDWTGDGITKIGVHQGDQFYLRNSNTAGPADATFGYGLAGDQAVAGDWDGDGIDTIGLYRNGVVYLRNSNTPGFADLEFGYGIPGDVLIGGDWNGDGVATIGVFRSSNDGFYLRNSNDCCFADLTFGYGIPGDEPVVNRANQAPVVSASGTLNYTEGQAATAIDTTVTVTDMDSAVLIGATAHITGNCAPAEDVLSFTTQNGISGVYTPASCLMTLTGESSVANYQTALRTVKYNNSAATPSTLARTVTWQTDDGAIANHLSNQPTSGITIGCPTINVSGTIPDLLRGQAMATATFTQTGGNGTITWSQTGLPTGVNIDPSTGDVTGTPTASGSFSVTIKATDAGGCFGTKVLTVHVNAPPGINSTNSYTKQIGTALSFSVTTTGPPTGGFPAATISQAPVGGQTGFPGGVTFTPSPGSAAIGGSVTSGGAQTYTTTITANNGVSPSDTQSFSLIITCPAISVTRNPVGAFPAGAYNVAYTGQSVTATGGTGPYSFVVATGALPTTLLLASNGGISGTPSATGTFTFTVTATDSTGCAGTSALLSIAINPVAGSDTYNNLVNNTEAVVTGGTTASPSTPFVPLTGFVTANDTPAGVTITSSNPITTTQGGSVTLAADGSFKYTPPVTVSALSFDTFTYTISSNTGGTTTATTANGTVTLNLSGRVWYVDPNAGSGGNGQSQFPWNSTANIKQQPTVGGANTGDIIFVYNGPILNLNANIPLLATQTLQGEGVALVVNSVTLRSAGTKPSLSATSNNVVSVNSGNTIKGLTLTNSTNSLITGSPAGLTVTTVTMTPSGTANGFSIAGGSGTIALTDTTMTGTSSGDVVHVTGGSQSWTFTNSPITQTAGRAINVSGMTGGGMNLDANSPVTVSAGTADGAITLATTGASAKTFSFAKKVQLTTSGAARGLVVSSSGTAPAVNITDGTSTITAGAAKAVDLSSATLNITLTSLTSSGAADGMTLTSTSGTFTVNGDGTGHANGSGGSISNATSHAGTFTTVSGTITLKSMNISITTAAIYGILFDNNSSGTPTANITGTTFTGVTSSVNQNKALLQFEAGQSGTNVTANVQNSFFNGSRTYGFVASGDNNAVVHATLNQSGFGTDVNTGAPVNNPGTTITNAPVIGMLIEGQSSGSNVSFTVSNNTFWGADGANGAIYAIGASGFTSGTLTGTFSGNKIGKTLVTSSGCASNCGGIGLLPGTSGTYNVTVTNNDIRQTNSIGIDFKNSVTAASGTTIGHITNNTLLEPDTTGSPLFLRAIATSSGNSGGSTANWCAEVTGNNTTGASWQAGSHIRTTSLNSTGILTIPGLTPTTGAIGSQIDTYIESVNSIGAGNSNATVGGAINGGSPCTPTP